MKPLATHGRFDYSPITGRPRYDWPNGGRLALYIGFNVEHFAFGEGLGARLAPAAAGVDVLNHAWREYGNRVGAWRCLELFESLAPAAGGDRQQRRLRSRAVAGRRVRQRAATRSSPTATATPRRKGAMSEADERALLLGCRERLHQATGRVPGGWLSPWISESARHARPAGRDRLPLHAELVPRRPADASSRRAPGRSGRSRIRRRSTTSR